MNAIVKRSALPSRSRFNGSKAGLPHARYHKIGNLYFSKKACEVFTVAHPDGGPRPPRELAIVEFDEDAKTLTFTAIDKPPKGLTEDECFPIIWHRYKDSPSTASIAMKRTLTYLGFEYKDAIDFAVASINPETHSIVLTLPDPLKSDGQTVKDFDRGIIDAGIDS